MTPFIIYALPRSKTAWVSRFLTHGLWECRHDASATVGSLEELARLLVPFSGICETGLAFAAPALRALVPGHKAVVIYRDVAQIKASLAQHGVELSEAFYTAELVRLSHIAALPGTLTTTFDKLNTEEGCRELFEYALGQPFDRAWWLSLKDKNIQIDLAEGVETGVRVRPAIAQMIKDAKAITGEPVIQEETWATFMRDGRNCIAEHIAEVCGQGDEPDPDYEYGELLYNMGRLQITTARVQGEMVGYILCIINRDPEYKSHIRATQIPFFVRRDYRGQTGLRLHAAMRQGAFLKGARKLTMRSGIRGVGPKQDALFRRLGAKEDGHMFTLNLEAA